MTDLDQRLANCFCSVFPDTPRDEVRSLRQRDQAAWDSVRHVTLIVTMEEEFGQRLDFNAFVGATSFEAVLTALRDALQ